MCDGHCFVTTASPGASHGGKVVGVGVAARGGEQPGTSWHTEERRGQEKNPNSADRTGDVMRRFLRRGSNSTNSLAF